MVGVEGTDLSGHMFRRIDPILITPISLKLDIPSLIGNYISNLMSPADSQCMTVWATWQ